MFYDFVAKGALTLNKSASETPKRVSLMGNYRFQNCNLKEWNSPFENEQSSQCIFYTLYMASQTERPHLSDVKRVCWSAS